MKRNIKYAIIIAILVIIAILINIFFSDQFHKISSNPPGTVGNTAGNLQNQGLFCESDGLVYFSNPYDKGYLYVMNLDETDAHPLNNSLVKYLNAGMDYLYYYQYDSKESEQYGFISNHCGLYRASKKDGSSVCLKKNVIGNIKLLQDTVFYLNYNEKNGYDLYKISTNKENDTRVLDGIADPSCYNNGKIYYQVQDSVNEHYLYSCDINSEAISCVYPKDIWYPQSYGSYIYYLDIHDNYALSRYDLSTGASIKLTSERIDCYNVVGEYIYYQVNSKQEPYLGMMRYDGSEQQLVMSGNYTQLNATSKYLYFKAFGSDTPIYHVPIGTTNVSQFNP